MTSRVCSLNLKIDHQYSLSLKIEKREKKKKKKVTPRVSLCKLKIVAMRGLAFRREIENVSNFLQFLT